MMIDVLISRLINLYQINYHTNIEFEQVNTTTDSVDIFFKNIGIDPPEDLTHLFNEYGIQNKGVGLFFGNSYHGFQGMQHSYKILTELYGDDLEANINKTNKYPESTIKDIWFSKYWIPIAGDKNGSYIFIDLDPGPSGKLGQIINVGGDDICNFKIANDISDFLELIIGLIDKSEYGNDGFNSLHDYLVHSSPSC